MAQVGFLAIFFVVEMIERSGLFAGVGFSVLFEYLSFRLPMMAHQVMGLSVLLAVMIVGLLLGRWGEMTAIRAAGFSIWSLLLPLELAALFLAGLDLVAVERILPKTNFHATYIKQVIVRQHAAASLLISKHWYLLDHQLLKITSVDSELQKVYGVSLYHLSDSNQVTLHVEAQSADWNGTEWIFRAGHRWSFEGSPAVPNVRPFDAWSSGVSLSPDTFRPRPTTPDEFGLSDLKQTLQQNEQLGELSTLTWADWYTKLAWVCIPLVMVPVGLAFVLHRQKKSSGASAITVTVVIGVAYYLALAIGTAICRIGGLPPLIATQLPNVGFFCFSAWRLYQVRW